MALLQGADRWVPQGVRLHTDLSARLQAYPLDLLRTRLAAQTTSSYYSGISGSLATIVRDEGFAGLYRGLGATLIQARPAAAIPFATHAQWMLVVVVANLHKRFGQASGWWMVFCSGCLCQQAQLRRQHMLQTRGNTPEWLSMCEPAGGAQPGHQLLRVRDVAVGVAVALRPAVPHGGHEPAVRQLRGPGVVHGDLPAGPGPPPHAGERLQSTCHIVSQCSVMVCTQMVCTEQQAFLAGHGLAVQTHSFCILQLPI